MPENPTQDRLGYIFFNTPQSSTRYYRYTLKDTLFYDRQNDPDSIYGMVGNFIEDVIISNVTISNSQIAIRGVPIYLIKNVTVNGVYFDSNIVNNDIQLLISFSILVSVNDAVFNNISFAETANQVLRFEGFNSVLILSNITFTNIDVFSKQAFLIQGSYQQMVISGVTAQNLTLDTDGLIVSIELATILQVSLFHFTNIHSYDSDSTNNFMVDIVSMDLSAAFPSVIQYVTVSNSTTGVLKVQTLAGNLTENNMLVVQNITIADCNITNSVDLITLTSLTTYEPYSIVFTNLVFQNLEFLQGSNMLNFEHLISAPVQLVNSNFNNIKGGMISMQSSSSSFTDLNTNLIMSNITANDINVKFGSFITLQTGAIVSISYSSFTNIN